MSFLFLLNNVLIKKNNYTSFYNATLQYDPNNFFSFFLAKKTFLLLKSVFFIWLFILIHIEVGGNENDFIRLFSAAVDFNIVAEILRRATGNNTSLNQNI